jgi:hypothetical protein
MAGSSIAETRGEQYLGGNPTDAGAPVWRVEDLDRRAYGLPYLGGAMKALRVLAT